MTGYCGAFSVRARLSERERESVCVRARERGGCFLVSFLLLVLCYIVDRQVLCASQG